MMQSFARIWGWRAAAWRQRSLVAVLVGACSCPSWAQPPPAMPSAAPDAQPSANATVQVSGVRVSGLTSGVSPDAAQAAADAALHEMAGDRPLPVALSLPQLQTVADRVTRALRDVGYLVARAYVPEQTVSQDGVVEICVREGRIGRVIVEGAGHYRPGVLAAATQALMGQAVRAPELTSAMLYARDLPGVSVSSVLKPGLVPGETDVVLVAREDKPWRVDVGVSNEGSPATGRIRPSVGGRWINPLGLGDVLAVNYMRALDPANSWQGAFSYSVPVAPVPGLGITAGYMRSQIELASGSIAELNIHGPTEQTYLGLDWKFVNTPTWVVQASARYTHETSRLDAVGGMLSKQAFDVIEGGVNVRRNSVGAIDLAQVSVRTAVRDGSAPNDQLYADHTPYFAVARAGYARWQGLGTNQRLLARVNGQFTNDTLTPLEQFAVGGPGSVRAYALSEALGDRGLGGTLEYQIDAPGFARQASPFGAPWGNVLTFKAFYDLGRVWRAGANRAKLPAATYQGVGVGADLHLPRQWHGAQLALTVAHPVGGTAAADQKDWRVWTRLNLSF